MKYAIPVNSKDESDNISSVLGRSKYFAVYDTEEKEFEYLDNPGVNQARGAGMAAAQFIADHEADKVLSVNIGPNVINALNIAKVEHELVEEQPLTDIKEKYLVNEED